MLARFIILALVTVIGAIGALSLRNLIHCAAERAIRDVYVDGQAVVKDHRVVNLDYDGAVRQLQDAQKRACRRAEQNDPQSRPLATLAPYSLPLARRG